jgi:dipeptidyl aminopeptidase/acylaminoacyl peptidase
MTENLLTAEYIVDMKHIMDVQLSVTGMAAYVLGPWAKKGEHHQSEIWVAPIDPALGEPRQFTSGEANDRYPRWSPDGSRLAFLSDRKERGTAQIHVMPVAGGEAIELTQGKKGVGDFAWSPDGATIAFTSADDPSEEEERREKERDDPRVFGERWGFARLRIIDATGGEVRTIVGGERHVDRFAWSPDGGRLACVLRPTPELDPGLGPAVIAEVSPGTGEERALATVDGWAEDFTYSPDGRWLLYVRSGSENRQASSALWRVSTEGGGRPERVAGGETSCILALGRHAGLDRPVCHVAEGLQWSLSLVDPADASLEPIYRPERGSFHFHTATLARVQGRLMLAVALSLPDCPAELYAGDPAGELTCITDHHADMASTRLGRQEEFRWTARDGWQLDGIVIRPPDGIGAGPLPTVVLVHGGPYGRWEDGFNLSWGNWGQWLATAGYAVLMPNPRGGYGHGEAFAAAARGDVGGADWLDILSAVDAAVERGIADPKRLGIGGWSQGGFMTAWAVTQTDRFRAGIDGAGPTEWGWMAATSDMGTFEAELGGSTLWDGTGPYRHSELSPLSFARRVTTPLLILHGENDARVPVSQATSFHRALREIGATVEMVIYPREAHEIAERNHQLDLLKRVREWYGKYLRG